MVELEFYVYNKKIHNKYGKMLFTMSYTSSLKLGTQSWVINFLNFCNKSVIKNMLITLLLGAQCKNIVIYSPTLPVFIK